MRRMYQTEWHGIPFSSLSTPSSVDLAGPEFYQAFYEGFFERYQGWEQLDSRWLLRKRSWGEFILERAEQQGKVLSIGCGIGALEHYMKVRAPRLELSIHEVAPTAWRWVAPEFTQDRKLLGMIPTCIPKGSEFDLIFLSAVDYTFDDANAVALLSSLRPFITRSGGHCLLISASLQQPSVTLGDKALSLARGLKVFAEAALDRVGLRPRQFWGWTRTQEEYQSLFHRAGYKGIEDGFIDPEHRSGYWISGS